MESAPNKDLVGKDASYIARAAGIEVPAETRLLLMEVGREHPLVWTEQLMPVLPLVRMRSVDEAIDFAVEVEHGFRHTAMIHSHDIEKLSRMAKVMNCSLFVKNGPCYAGLGQGGAGYHLLHDCKPHGGRDHPGADLHPRAALHAGGLFQDHMKLGRVIGRVVCTQKMECFEGLKLLLVQPVDENGKDAGAALVAFDVARAGEGDLVFFEAGKEAAQANPNGWFNPADAAIIGVVDAVNGAQRRHDAGQGDGKRGFHGEARPLQGSEDPGGAARGPARGSRRAGASWPWTGCRRASGTWSWWWMREAPRGRSSGMNPR